jgi:TolA protein
VVNLNERRYAMRTIIILLAVLATSLAFAADQKVYTEATGPKVQTSVPANSSGADYISPIRARIQDKFHVPASMDKNLAAIINIRISKSGSVTILGFEKKSGNPLYDSAAIKAINDAGPFPPAPAEMEIGMRFYSPSQNTR